MADFDDNRFASKNQEWETPDWLFDKIDKVFHFTRDVCASRENAKCSLYWTENDSCLDKTWDGVNWMNPPYNNARTFVEKAYRERSNAITVCLIPARTNTNWWHEYCMKGEILFLRGRPRFVGHKHGLPQPLALVIFGKKQGIMGSFDVRSQE